MKIITQDWKIYEDFKFEYITVREEIREENDVRVSHFSLIGVMGEIFDSLFLREDEESDLEDREEAAEPELECVVFCHSLSFDEIKQNFDKYVVAVEKTVPVLDFRKDTRTGIEMLSSMVSKPYSQLN